MFFEYFEVC